MRSKTAEKYSTLLPITATALAIAAMMLHSSEAVESAREGLYVCARVIIPSLFPFYVLSGLLSQLGMPYYLGRMLSPVMSRLFGVSGEGASAFVLGLSGGYPLGAADVVSLYKEGRCDKKEAEKLLSFCNNSGPAFIIGAAGAGIFGSAGTGLMLFLVHAAAAMLVGIMVPGGKPADIKSQGVNEFKALSFSKVFSRCVTQAVTTTLTVCGFVIFFSVAVGILEAVGFFTNLSGMLSYHLGLELHFTRSLLTGILELGSGIGSMQGLAPSPMNLALAAFITGWGGLSVHSQVLALTADCGLSIAGHTIGKLLHGLLSAVLVLIISSIWH